MVHLLIQCAFKNVASTSELPTLFAIHFRLQVNGTLQLLSEMETIHVTLLQCIVLHCTID